jgi:hypothetical protein
MGRSWVHTVQQNGRWQNEIEGEGTQVQTFLTKEDAVEAGRMLARWRQAEHLIHNRDDTIAERNSYGRNP